MTKQEINITMAKECGWTIDPELNYVIKPNTSLKTFRGYNDITEMFPDFCNDLNAMHEAENGLSDEEENKYDHELREILTRDYVLQKSNHVRLWKLQCIQRAEAYLRVKGKWVD